MGGKLRVGDILLVPGFKPIKWFLQIFQSDKVTYSHVAMMSTNNTVIEAGPKVQRRSIDEFMKFNKKCKVIRLKGLKRRHARALNLEMKSQLGNLYGWRRILLQALDHITFSNWFTRRYDAKKYQVCSSLVAWAYHRVLNIKFNGVFWQSCEPDDIDDESEKNKNKWHTFIVEDK